MFNLGYWPKIDQHLSMGALGALWLNHQPFICLLVQDPRSPSFTDSLSDQTWQSDIHNENLIVAFQRENHQTQWRVFQPWQWLPDPGSTPFSSAAEGAEFWLRADFFRGMAGLESWPGFRRVDGALPLGQQEFWIEAMKHVRFFRWFHGFTWLQMTYCKHDLHTQFVFEQR